MLLHHSNHQGTGHWPSGLYQVQSTEHSPLVKSTQAHSGTEYRGVQVDGGKISRVDGHRRGVREESWEEE